MFSAALEGKMGPERKGTAREGRFVSSRRRNCVELRAAQNQDGLSAWRGCREESGKMGKVSTTWLSYACELHVHVPPCGSIFLPSLNVM